MSAPEICEKTWTGGIVEHKGFKDLGRYVIELPDYTDPSVQERGLALMNDGLDRGEFLKGGCTAMIKKNSCGEVIVGRNMDLEVSQCPAFVYKTSFGRYQNFCVTYIPGAYMTYAEAQKLDELDENLLSRLIYGATDCFNEKGLYIETNLRDSNAKLVSYGLHSSCGEKQRSDGRPWSELRVCNLAVPQLVSQNCATVREALEFLKNSYDWYTINNSLVSNNGSNMNFIIGDAAGEYGLIEMAQDEISYLPYQFGQANYYITPKWNVLDACCIGTGRLQKVSEVIADVETADEAMEAMKPIMWRNETLWIGESVRAEGRVRRHSCSQIIFRDDKGNPQLDWRSDYVGMWPVLDDGRLMIAAQMYEDAANSTYDPKIKEYFDGAVKCGTLIVDDGSVRFNAGGRRLTLTELHAKYAEYAKSAADLEKQAELEPYYREYRRLKMNGNSLWVHNDKNFEALKAAAYAKLHIRYNENGRLDSSCMSKYEKLCAFYGYGTEKDETPLRNDGSVWTTSLNVGVNCARKEMKIRFWENDELIYKVKF